MSQVLSFGLKSETVLVSDSLAIHKIVETKFSLKFGLKRKADMVVLKHFGKGLKHYFILTEVHIFTFYGLR